MQLNEFIVKKDTPSISPVTRWDIDKLHVVGNYFSFTNLPKLGINPKTDYATPIGVYGYTSSVPFDTNIPFASHRPYVTFFTPRGNVLDLQAISHNDAWNYLLKLRNVWLPDLPVDELTKLWDDTHDVLIKFENYSNIDAGVMYGVMRKLASMSALSSKKGSVWKKSTQTPSRWTKMLLSLGIDALLDNGDGIIHPNEPYQIVVINPSGIRVITRLDNPLRDNQTMVIKFDHDMISLLKWFRVSDKDKQYILSRARTGCHLTVRNQFGRIIPIIVEPYNYNFEKIQKISGVTL
jgi:hypothetical protein